MTGKVKKKNGGRGEQKRGLKRKMGIGINGKRVYMVGKRGKQEKRRVE